MKSLDLLAHGRDDRHRVARERFLVQELHREANTLGAKVNDAASSHLVVELRAEIDRMKEQAANVE